MKTTIEHIENYYREIEGISFDQVDLDEGNIKVKLGESLQKSILANLLKENGGLIAWVEHDINLSNFQIIIYDSLTKTANTFSLFGEPDFDGYEFYSFVWMENLLFCIYQGDHDYFYVHTIEGCNSTKLFIKGDAVRVFETFLTFQNYGRSQPIYKVEIPQLLITNQYSEAEAKSMDIMPSGLGLMYYLDHNFYNLD